MGERSQKYSIEELNEHGHGWRVDVQHDKAIPNLVSFDMVYMMEGEDTEQDIGVLMTPKVAFRLASLLNQTASDVQRGDDDNAEYGW